MEILRLLDGEYKPFLPVDWLPLRTGANAV